MATITEIQTALQNLTNSKTSQSDIANVLDPGRANIEGGRPCKVCGGGLDEEETEDY